MKIRTTEMLSDKLSQELSWRKKELSALKFLIEKTSLPVKAKGILPRCGIALLYAHWEGFIKLGGRYYLEFVTMQRLKNSELSDNLLTLIIKDEINRRLPITRASQFNWITEFFMGKGDSRSLIPYKNIIDTESNLSSKVLKEILWCLGIDYSFYEPNEN